MVTVSTRKVARFSTKAWSAASHLTKSPCSLAEEPTRSIVVFVSKLVSVSLVLLEDRPNWARRVVRRRLLPKQVVVSSARELSRERATRSVQIPIRVLIGELIFSFSLITCTQLASFRRRANAKGAVEARLLAAEERMKKEQKDKQNESKPFKEETIDRKPKVELDSDGEWEDAEPDEIEWTKAEEEWMKDDLAHWNDDALIISGQGAVASGSGLSKEKDKGKGKRRASAESPPDVKRAFCSTASQRCPYSLYIIPVAKKIIDLSSDSDVPTKKRKTSSSSSSRASGSSKKPMEVIDLSSDSD